MNQRIEGRASRAADSDDVADATIRAIAVRAVRVPMPTPHRTAGGDIVESPLVLTDITTDEGVIGRSMVFTYTVAALVPVARFIANLEPLLVGQSALPLEIDRLLARRFKLLGTQGLVGIGLSAIDMALWDAQARRHRVSLVRLLGADAKRVPVYGGIGYDGAVQSARQAEAWAAKGIRSVKPKIGYPSVREDVDVVRAIRNAVGDDAEVMVDYNQSLDPVEAAARLRVLDDEGLLWIEEPTSAHDFHGMAAIAAAIRTPIQAGENWWGPRDVATAIAIGASDHLMPDVMKIGGVTGWLRTAALAQAKGMPLSNHLFPEISAQLLSATPTAFRLEYADWWNAVLAEPLRIVDGATDIDATKPGTGIEWDERAVARMLVD